MAKNDAATEVPMTPAELFDSIGPAYETAFADLQPRDEAIKWAMQQIQDRKPAKVLDLGCGTGRPVCSAFADAGHDVLGVDVSDVMLSDARAKVPKATFMKADVLQMELPQQSFDAIIIFFSLIAGTSQDSIRGQIKKVYDWLKPDGALVFATVPISIDQAPSHFLGRSFIGSSLSQEEYLHLFRQVGFEIVKQNLSSYKSKAVEAGICTEAENGEEPHLFIQAKKQPSK